MALLVAFTPFPNNGGWFVLTGSAVLNEHWGTAGDIPVPGDYNVDGWTDYAVWRPTTGYWYILDSLTYNEHHLPLPWTQNGDVPIPSAYNRY